MFKKEKGITLIALIVTIVVLIILAGITITGTIQGVDQTNNNKLITDLDKVHHAITQRDSKYKLTKDESLLIGTVVKSSNIDVTGLSESEKITWKMLYFDGVTDPERDYYRLSGSDLVELGLTSDPTTTTVYVVNYFTGEAYNETQKKTEDGKLLYVTSTTEQVSEMGDEIIKDGLLVWYDAENNTGSGHSSTTTVWKDLSGNGNDAALYGFDGTATSGWNSNYLAFDGVDDYATASAVSNGDFTIEVLTFDNEIINSYNYGSIYYINNWNAQAKNPSIMIFKDYRNNNYQFYLGCLVPKDDEHSSYSQKNFGLDKTLNKVLYVIRKNNNKISISTNGIEYKKSVDNEFINRFKVKDMNINIARYADYGYMKQKVNTFRIYNRALSDDEIRHNYILDKARYGIEE